MNADDESGRLSQIDQLAFEVLRTSRPRTGLIQDDDRFQKGAAGRNVAGVVGAARSL